MIVSIFRRIAALCIEKLASGGLYSFKYSLVLGQFFPYSRVSI